MYIRLLTFFHGGSNEVLYTAAEGNGPVNALDKALRKALIPHYPVLSDFQLADYKVRILDGSDGTSAVTRVLIDTHNGARRWTTVGASVNNHRGQLAGVG